MLHFGLEVPFPMSVSRCCSVVPRSFGGQRARLHKLWTSSLELCSVDIAPDRRRQEVLVVPPRAPCEDGDHVPAGDVVPALAGARRRLTVRESFTEIASDVVPTWPPISSILIRETPLLGYRRGTRRFRVQFLL